MAKLKELNITKVKLLNTSKLNPTPKRADRLYDDPAWRQLRVEFIRQYGEVCMDPTHDPERPRADVRIELDHIREVKDGGAPMDRANLILRCRSCHARKTHAERAKRR